MPPCDFGLRSWISPASTTSAVSVPGRNEGGRAGGQLCLSERPGPSFSGKGRGRGVCARSLWPTASAMRTRPRAQRFFPGKAA